MDICVCVLDMGRCTPTNPAIPYARPNGITAKSIQSMVPKANKIWATAITLEHTMSMLEREKTGRR